MREADQWTTMTHFLLTYTLHVRLLTLYRCRDTEFKKSDLRPRCAVRPPVSFHSTKPKWWRLMLEVFRFSVCFSPLRLVLAELQCTQHDSGFSVCCVIRPWPAFWTPDPWPNETVSPVPLPVPLVPGPNPRLLRWCLQPSPRWRWHPPSRRASKDTPSPRVGVRSHGDGSVCESRIMADPLHRPLCSSQLSADFKELLGIRPEWSKRPLQ